MAIDIRATVTCSLGTLISGSVSDDYLQGSGLVKTRGSCEISGLITPAVGTLVTFSYTKAGVTRTIPRQLLVLSSFADPLRRTTKVQLGCRFTYLQNKKEAVEWDQYDDPENADATAAEAQIVVRPIHASSVALECLSQLGVAGTVPLTNKFSVDKFDFSSGYVDVLSNLLVSESLCGYITEDGSFSVFSLADTGGTGPVINGTNIVDIAEISVGSLPGDAVTVSYSTLKLNEPEQDDADKNDEERKRDWELDEVVGQQTRIKIDFKAGDESQSYVFNYIPRQVTVTKYDEWDRVTVRTTTDYKIGAAVNPSYIQASAEYDFANDATVKGLTAVTYGQSSREFVTVTNITYKLTARNSNESAVTYNPIGVFGTVALLPSEAEPNDLAKVSGECYKEYIYRGSGWEPLEPGYKSTKAVLPEGYDEVESEVVTSYEPVDAILGSIAPGYVDEDNNFLSLPSGTAIASIATTTFEKRNRIVTIDRPSTASGNLSLDVPVTKTITVSQKAFAYSNRGQQDLASRVQQGQNINEFISAAIALTEDGIEVRTVSGREATLQTRPSKAQQILAKAADTSNQPEAESTGGYRVSSSSELELASGSLTSQNRIEYSMPYAPDDTFVRTGTCPEVTYIAVSSDAAAKARTYGRVQNKLLLGNRYGMNIQLAPELVPAAPFSPLMVQLAGSTAMYRLNGTSWTMNSGGVLASTDALFWGAVGGTGTFWFPVAPGITTLPTTPPVVDGQMTVTTVVPAWNETVPLVAQVRIGNVVSKFAYALEVLTEVDPLVVTLGVTAARVKLLASDAGAFTLSGQTAALVRRYRMASAAGSFALNGFSAGSVRDYVIGTNAGTFTATGQAAMLEYERLPLIAEAGAINLTGADAILQFIQTRIAAEVGAFSITGQVAGLLRTLKLSAEAGTFSLNGQDATLIATLSQTEVLYYTGTASALSVTGAGFEPGFVALKRRAATANHGWYDHLRGTGVYIPGGQATAEQTLTTGLTSFDADGFSLDTSTVFNTSSATHVAWCLPKGGAAANNTDGTKTVLLSANSSVEYSLFTYTGDGSSSVTIGHGLSGTPDLVLIKSRALSTGHYVGSPSIGVDKHFVMSSTSATATSSTTSYKAFGSTTLTIGQTLNQNGPNYAGIALKAKAGTSNFSTFTGNGSATYTETLGYQPKMLIIKNITTTTSDWLFCYRPSGGTGYVTCVRLNTSGAEFTSTTVQITSTGFSVDVSGPGNVSGGTTEALYWAMA